MTEATKGVEVRVRARARRAAPREVRKKVTRAERKSKASARAQRPGRGDVALIRAGHCPRGPFKFIKRRRDGRGDEGRALIVRGAGKAESILRGRSSCLFSSAGVIDEENRGPARR